MLPNVPHCTLGIQADAGHNLSLGWSARAYHLRVMAFVESCIVRRQLLGADVADVA